MKVSYSQYLQMAATLVIGFTSTADAECLYDVNDEWPLVSEMVCQSDDPLPGVLLLADDTATSDARPVCVRADSDPDGDGWGWENRQSCRVTGAGAPACVSASSDPDGDGWGWEQNRSCRVVSPKIETRSVCASSQSDPDGDGWGYENGRSCRVAGVTSHPDCTAAAQDPDGDGWGWENNRSCRVVSAKQQSGNGTVFEQNFDSSSAGAYTAQQLNEDWDNPLWHLGFVQGRVAIVAEPQRGNVMQVTYPANRYGAAGAAAFLSDLKLGVDLPESYEELYLSYDIKFGEGFEFVKGGKLPGLCGFDNTSLPVTGCNTGGGFPSGFDGWSARGMWREDGVLENYVYHSEQQNFYGDDLYWEAKAQPGTWHHIQHRVLLNTPDFANGVLEAWLDGEKVLSLDNLRYRKTQDIGINLFYFSTFYGGNDPSWAPSRDQIIMFDNFRISTQPEELAIGKALVLGDPQAPVTNSSSGGGGALSFGLILLLLPAGVRRRFN
jgi:hypothetical protein